MASIEPYETSSGRRYRVRYRDPQRRQREKAGFVLKIDAEDYLANVTVSPNRGDYVDPETPALRFKNSARIGSLISRT